MEKWKPIKGFEGLYEVSNMGNVKSVKRNTTSGKVLKKMINKDGYYQVCLCKENVKRTYRVHRLVAMAFIEGYTSEKSIVNHKNENKLDNRAKNLEWCTIAYNNSYNGGIYKRANKRKKPIKVIKDGKEVCYESAIDAANDLKIRVGNIYSCLKKRYGRKTVSGYHFEYIKKTKGEK